MSLDICLPESWKDWTIVGEEPIGRGSYGAVYKAQREVGERSVYSAIKVIEIPHDDEELQSIRLEYDEEESVKEYFLDIKDRYVKEIEWMAEFRGISNIVSIEDFLVEPVEDFGWRIFIRMEYLEDLRLWIRENELTEEEVIKIASDICNALIYCEKQNIIHRDIKPANILRSPMGDYKLGDFGIAMIGKQGSGSYSSKGTYEYMAPEVYKGEHYGLSADIYSLGIVLYWLTNRTHEKNRNRFPFESTYKEMLTYKEKENALTRRMNGETFAEPANASPELSKIILKACTYHPQDRYQNASEMLQDLNALKVEDAQAEGSVHEEETASSGGHKILPVAAAVIILAVLAIAGLGFGRLLAGNGNSRQEPEEVKATEKNAGGEKEEDQMVEVSVVPEANSSTASKETEAGSVIETEMSMQKMTETPVTESAASSNVETLDADSNDATGSQENERVYQKYKEIIDEALDGFSQGDPLYTKYLSVGQTDTPGGANVWPDIISYSTDESVVTVNEEGKVTAEGPGTAYVFLMSESAYETYSSFGESPISQVYQYNVSSDTSGGSSTGAAGFDYQQTLDDLSQQLDEWMNSN